MTKLDFYKYHLENSKSILLAINSIQLEIRNCIRKKEEEKEYSYTKLLSHLIICWCEESIKKLYYEANAFTLDEIEKLLEQNLPNKWMLSLKVAFCKAYKLKRNNDKLLFQHIKNPEESTRIPIDAKLYYIELKKLIEQDLFPAIDIRNKIAHGEWKKAFDTPYSKLFSAELTKEIRKENIVSLQLKLNLFKALYKIIFDLTVYKKNHNAVTFERDFADNYKIIEVHKLNLHNRNYSDFKNQLIVTYELGKLKKSINKKNSLTSPPLVGSS